MLGKIRLYLKEMLCFWIKRTEVNRAANLLLCKLLVFIPKMKGKDNNADYNAKAQ